MRLSLCLLAFAVTDLSFAAANVPLDQMRCSGPFQDPRFFEKLERREDLNTRIAELGRAPDTFYKFELASDVFVRPPSFNGGHGEEFVFLSIDSKGLSISRFALLVLHGKELLHLLAQAPVAVDQDQRVLKYRSEPPSEPDWTCRY